ncbi:hydrolase [Streptococcus pneumoniae]|nr:hydrolase [Streptococcus pneumoniae]
MTKKIIAVDLDGTLLNSDSQISDFTKKTIKKVAEKAIRLLLRQVALTVCQKIFTVNWA